MGVFFIPSRIFSTIIVSRSRRGETVNTTPNEWVFLIRWLQYTVYALTYTCRAFIQEAKGIARESLLTNCIAFYSKSGSMAAHFRRRCRGSSTACKATRTLIVVSSVSDCPFRTFTSPGKNNQYHRDREHILIHCKFVKYINTGKRNKSMIAEDSSSVW